MMKTLRRTVGQSSVSRVLRRSAVGVALVVGLGTSGCLRSQVIDARIAVARESAEALETVGDADVARAGLEAQLAELEGLYRLAPSEDDTLFALVRGWTLYGSLFLQDARESAELSGNQAEVTALDYKQRHALERAVGFGLQAFGKRGSGLDEARRTRDGLTRWVEDKLGRKSDAELSYWVGRAWLARSRLAKDDRFARVFEPFVGQVLVTHSHRVAPGYARYGALVAMSETLSDTPGGAEDARRNYDLLLEKTERKSLGVLVSYATHYACQAGDALLYERLLDEALATVDPSLEDRLSNLFAKRRARRALGKDAMKACKLAPGAPAPPGK